MKFLTRKKLLAALAIVLLGVGICLVWAAKSSRAEEKPVGIQVICSTNDAGQPQFTFQFTNRTAREIEAYGVDTTQHGRALLILDVILQGYESKRTTATKELEHGRTISFGFIGETTRVEEWRATSASWLNGKGLRWLGSHVAPKVIKPISTEQLTIP